MAQTKHEPKTFEQALDIMFAECKRIMLEKRAQRGTANIIRQGAAGVIRRFLEDKYERLHRASDDLELARIVRERRLGADICPPRLEQDALAAMLAELPDCANYALIAWALVEGWWTLPDSQLTRHTMRGFLRSRSRRTTTTRRGTCDRN